tara:strand:- start:194 stop:457 length:264 start_codon:yes stop_codon:yes gene_type:complete
MSKYLQKIPLSSAYNDWDDQDLILEINRVMSLSFARKTPVVNLVINNMRNEWNKRHPNTRVPKVILDEQFIFNEVKNEKKTEDTKSS